MGKVPNKRNSLFPRKRNSSRRNKPSETNKPVPKENNIPSNQPQQVKGPSLMDSVKSGFGFGIGNAAVHSILGGFGEVSSGNTDSIKRDIHTQTVTLCESTLKNYNECLELHSDKFHPTCIELKKFMENLKCHETK